MARRNAESVVLAPERIPWMRDPFIATRKHFGLLMGPLVGLILWTLPLGLEPVQTENPGHCTFHDYLLDCRAHRPWADRTDRHLSFLGTGGRKVSGRFQWFCKFHNVVSI